MRPKMWIIACVPGGRAVRLSTIHTLKCCITPNRSATKKPFSKTARSHLKGLIYYYNKHGYWFSRQKVQQKWIDPASGMCGALNTEALIKGRV